MSGYVKTFKIKDEDKEGYKLYNIKFMLTFVA